MIVSEENYRMIYGRKLQLTRQSLHRSTQTLTMSIILIIRFTGNRAYSVNQYRAHWYPLIASFQSGSHSFFCDCRRIFGRHPFSAYHSIISCERSVQFYFVSLISLETDLYQKLRMLPGTPFLQAIKTVSSDKKF